MFLITREGRRIGCVHKSVVVVSLGSQLKQAKFIVGIVYTWSAVQRSRKLMSSGLRIWLPLLDAPCLRLE